MLSLNGELTEEIKTFLTDQEQFVVDQYKENPDDAYNFNAYLLYIQLKGLRDQYNAEQTEETKKITDVNFNIISAMADIPDIKNKYNPKDYHSMSYPELKTDIFLNSHCSAMFKTKADVSDIFFGHNTWYYYSILTKIFKEYNFNFKHESVKAHNIMFTSYPGALNSNDDFYITSTNLAVMETSNPNFNTSLYSLITTNSYLCWERVMIANRMSITAKEWSTHFGVKNSGTYNNMFMALNMNKIDLAQKKIMDEALYSIDQLPGYLGVNDITEYLKYGYWPSYNVPFDKKVYELSGIANLIYEKPEIAHDIDYDICSRAMIMRRDQSKIESWDDFKKFLRTNDYKNEPFSYGSPTNVVSARGDLGDAGKCSGALDGKAVALSDINGETKKVYLIAGPSNQEQETFNWTTSTACKNVKHDGLLEEYKLDWFEYENRFKMTEN